jgi:hypothetical protein
MYNHWYMQTTQNTRTITIPAAYVAQIARLLQRCASHEDERARGRVTFPLVVMKELAQAADHWSRYLEGALEDQS